MGNKNFVQGSCQGSGSDTGSGSRRDPWAADLYSEEVVTTTLSEFASTAEASEYHAETNTAPSPGTVQRGAYLHKVPIPKSSEAGGTPHDYTGTTEGAGTPRRVVVKRLKVSELPVVQRNHLFFTAEVKLELPSWSSSDFPDLVIYVSNRKMTKARVELSRLRIRECSGDFTLRGLSFVDEDPDLGEIGGFLEFKFPQEGANFGQFFQERDESLASAGTTELGNFQASSRVTTTETFYGPERSRADESLANSYSVNHEAPEGNVLAASSRGRQISSRDKLRGPSSYTTTTTYSSPETWASLAKNLAIRVLYSDAAELFGETQQVLRFNETTVRREVKIPPGSVPDTDSARQTTTSTSTTPTTNSTTVFDELAANAKLASEVVAAIPVIPPKTDLLDTDVDFFDPV